MAKRIQLRRTKGWRKPAGTVVVSRPSKWGNPWKVVKDKVGYTIYNGEVIQAAYPAWMKEHAYRIAINCYRSYIALADIETLRSELAGHDLACWCPLDMPCHADVLLELANPREAS